MIASVRGWVIVLVAGCGRIAFDPIATGTSGDGGTTGDGKRDGGGVIVGDGAIDAPPDAFNACSVAIAVTQGVRSAQSTCQGRDLLDGCGPASTQEVVFAFTPAATQGYQIQAYDPGTSNISNSTVQLAAGCTATSGGCTGILGTTLNAGTTYYFAIEASGGGCANIEFLVQ